MLIQDAVLSAQRLNLAKKSLVKEFVLHLILVLLDIRDAYLVDVFQLSNDKLKVLIETVCRSVGYARPLILATFATEDIIIINPLSIIRKTTPIRYCDCFTIVSICSKDPVVVEASSVVQDIESALRKTIDPIFTLSNNIDSDHGFQILGVMLELQDDDIIGYEFLAGWLLGYACIYNARGIEGDNQDNHDGGGALSMQPLRKISISADLTVSETDKVKLPIQEFTIPDILYSDSTTSQKVRSYVEQLEQRISSLCYNDLFISKWGPFNVLKDEKVVVCSSLVF